MYHASTNDDTPGVTRLISGRADFRARKVIRDEENHYIITKGQILQEDIANANVCESNRASKYVKQKLIKLERKRYKSTHIARNCNTSLLEIDRPSRKKIGKCI